MAKSTMDTRVEGRVVVGVVGGSRNPAQAQSRIV